MDVRLKLPLTVEEVRRLSLGDIVYLSGALYTARDEAHLRMLEHKREGKPIPVNLEGSAIFHCGPIVERRGDGWRVVAAGPTTSSRMNSMEPQTIREFGIRAVVGKGGMDNNTVKAMQEHGCVYLAITGGAAVLAAKGVKEVKGVHWLDLGMPEAFWVLEVEGFGPLTVAVDAHGHSLYEMVDKEVERNIPRVRERLGI